MDADLRIDTERLAELLRGLEIGPMAATLSPKKLFTIGAAIAAQAKEAQPPAVSVTDGLVNALRHQRQIDEDGAEVGVSRQAVDEAIAILTMLAAQENPNG